MTYAEKVAGILRDSAHIVRNVAEQRDAALGKVAELELKVAGHERRMRAEKVAAEMHEKGINTDTSFADLVVSLEKSAQQGKLEQIEAAVEMYGPHMGLKTASLEDTPEGDATSELEAFLVGRIG